MSLSANELEQIAKCCRQGAEQLEFVTREWEAKKLIQAVNLATADLLRAAAGLAEIGAKQ